MDLGSIIGMVGGSALLLFAVVMGGPIGLFVNVPSFLIVVGGSLDAAFITYEMKDVITAIKAGIFVFKNTQDDPNNLIKDIITIAKSNLKNKYRKISFLQKMLNRPEIIGKFGNIFPIISNYFQVSLGLFNLHFFLMKMM